MKFLESLNDFEILGINLAMVLSAVFVLVVCVIARRMIARIVFRAIDKSHLEASLKGFIRSAVGALLWALVIIIVFDRLGIPVTSLVAVLSVAGLALSLSIQGILENLFSGMTLLATRPFVSGDYVEIGTLAGTVRDVKLFYTVLVTVDNKIIHVPNSTIVASSVVNFSERTHRRVDITVSASYGSEPEKVKAALLEAADDPRVIDDPAPFCALESFGDSGISYILRVWVKNEEYFDTKFDINERILTSFKKHGVEMTYSHINVHILDK